jgi:hypothetical protein
MQKQGEPDENTRRTSHLDYRGDLVPTRANSVSNTVSKDLPPVPQMIFRPSKLSGYLRSITAAHVLEFTPCEQISDPFLKGTFGCVPGQALQMEAFDEAPLENVPDHLCPKHWRTIPDDEHVTGDLVPPLSTTMVRTCKSRSRLHAECVSENASNTDARLCCPSCCQRSFQSLPQVFGPNRQTRTRSPAWAS